MEENNMQIEQKPVNQNNNMVTIFLLLLVVALVGVLIYVLVLKPKDETKPVDNNGGTQTTNVLSNDEALRIAKEKVEAANNFWGSFKSSDECADSISDGYCYYDTSDNFKNKFYSVYSKELIYTDVYNGEVIEGQAMLKFSDNKVYVWNHCTMGSGDYSLKGNYEIKSVTSDTIIGEYIMTQDNSSYGGTKTDEAKEVKLVKEDNEWKVAKITILGICSSAYEVGK